MKLLFSLVFLISAPVLAQQDSALSSSHGSNTAEDLKLKQNSKLFTVNVVPGAKSTEFLIAGKKAGEFSASRLKLRGTYRMNGQNVPMSITRQQDRFTTSDPVQGKEMILDISDEESGKSDRIRINPRQ